jgi:NADPH-dependent ferric siderophore reductase
MDCTESEEFFTAKLEYGRIYCFEIDIETLEFHIETVTHTHTHTGTTWMAQGRHSKHAYPR